MKPEEFFETFKNELPTQCLEKEKVSQMGSPLLDYFYNLGKRKGFKSWAKHSNRGPRKETWEYLVDVCWENKKSVTLSLAMEVEVSDSSFEGIMHDLEKLLHVKATLKVGICYPNKSEHEKVLDTFSEMISNYELKIRDEQYLVIFLDHEHDKRKGKWLLKISGYEFELNGRRHLIGQKECVW